VVGNPKIAILDELTTGLDPEARRDTWALIERMTERGVTVILVTTSWTRPKPCVTAWR
jgi:ABC-2 type transport system ATP-binding protein